jgi:uncharacterized protein YqjF (DUF2071 family)
LNYSSAEKSVKVIEACRPDGSSLNNRAKARMLSRQGEPLFVANWDKVLMIHFEVDAEALQREVPFELDLRDNRGFISLVAFTMRGMRLAFGGRLTSWLFRPVATHDFLNVRTYVRQGGETGIHFLTEWLSNRLAVWIGPATFSLPYRHGRITYRHNWQSGGISGRVADATSRFAYHANFLPHMRQKVDAFLPCEPGSLDEWLMERYSAFNSAAGRRKFFSVWHPPWPQVPMQVSIIEDTRLTSTWPWFKQALLVGANFSPGLSGVWMGRPQNVRDVSP